MTKPFKQKNRRAATRYALRMPLQYRLAGGTAGPAWKRGRMLDMSARGILIGIPEAAPVGSTLELPWTGPASIAARR
jgi:hypothetical protein